MLLFANLSDLHIVWRMVESGLTCLLCMNPRNNEIMRKKLLFWQILLNQPKISQYLYLNFAERGFLKIGYCSWFQFCAQRSPITIKLRDQLSFGMACFSFNSLSSLTHRVLIIFIQFALYPIFRWKWLEVDHAATKGQTRREKLQNSFRRNSVKILKCAFMNLSSISWELDLGTIFGISIFEFLRHYNFIVKKIPTLFKNYFKILLMSHYWMCP